VRIALVCPYDWAAPGGVQVHVRELSDRLRARDHEAIVLAPASRPVDDDRVRIVAAPIAIPYNRSTAPIDPRPWHVRAVRSMLLAFAPDVVHVHEPLVPNTSMWAVLAADVPVVATFHSGADRSRLFDVAAPVLRRVARRISGRIAVSERAAAFVRARVPGSFTIVPNGIDVGAFAGAEPADLGPGRKLLFVGRLHPRKGFSDAVGAYRSLAGTRPDLRLIVAGAGADAAATTTLPPALRDRVVMLGPIENRSLPPIHRACDVFLAPSIGGESFGVVLLEAMAAGVPVVATRIPGYVEVVQDGVSGLLVPPRDPATLAAAAARVLDDAALAGRFRRAALNRVRRFDWDVVTEQVEAVYRDVLREPPPVR
jgi:phosphatidylinositol alpha-mannosyltransferase